jgi:dUTP pyrophosphatase
MGCDFEIVSKFADEGLELPMRKTEFSAGYDLVAAVDTVIPSMFNMMEETLENLAVEIGKDQYLSLETMAELTKQADYRPTLVSTGVKCKLEPGTYLELSVRSSTPLKHWLLLANGVGIIDADYYNNESNEGEIFLQMINLSPFNIMVKKGEAIGQGIIKSYLTTDSDKHGGLRTGGFGSTTV